MDENDPFIVLTIKSCFRSILISVFYMILAPRMPIIDVTRSARSEDTVALFFNVSSFPFDIIDSCDVRYWKEEQRGLGITVRMKERN